MINFGPELTTQLNFHNSNVTQLIYALGTMYQQDFKYSFLIIGSGNFLSGNQLTNNQ